MAVPLFQEDLATGIPESIPLFEARLAAAYAVQHFGALVSRKMTFGDRGRGRLAFLPQRQLCDVGWRKRANTSVPPALRLSPVPSPHLGTASRGESWAGLTQAQFFICLCLHEEDLRPTPTPLTP